MNKAVILAPKDITKGQEFVLMPKGDYKAFFEVEIKKIIPVVTPTALEKRAIERSRREFSKGEYVTLNELERDLARHRAQKRSKTN